MPLPRRSFKLSAKSLLQWGVVGGALFFLLKAFGDHWQEVATIRIDAAGWVWVAIALLTTLGAHLWSGWVWSWILRELGHPVPGRWAMQVYLVTNIAKYLPGNVWHFYGRITAAQARSIGVGVAILSVVLEALLMAAAALMAAIVGLPRVGWLLQGLALAIALLAIHPRLLNPVLSRLSRSKAKGVSSSLNAPPAHSSRETATPLALARYPLKPLLGELGFFALRSAGFLGIVAALHSLTLANLLPVMGAFSIAWLLGLVIPGAPGGIGVFEATAIALLQPNLSPGIVLGAVAIYRLVSTAAEALGAAIGVAIRSRRTLG
ncbi:MAG: YbhN family protein [Kaiparowitsia implicata GSE-PSE-MK54-09C]|jgi:uncharacterized membrane protein YbhN (UPF0104 family)|nr:YbhN family protein [Kaiparowitsia implicata GSE-PSE-MK54-09C]